MTITIPKPLVALLGVALAAGLAFALYEEAPALRRSLEFETM